MTISLRRDRWNYQLDSKATWPPHDNEDIPTGAYAKTYKGPYDPVRPRTRNPLRQTERHAAPRRAADAHVRARGRPTLCHERGFVSEFSTTFCITLIPSVQQSCPRVDATEGCG